MEGIYTRRFLAFAAAVAGLVPVAVACHTYTPGPGFNGTEGPVCVAAPGCNPYWSCPGGDTCPWAWDDVFGNSSCPCTMVTIPCRAYIGGIVDPSGCCTLGTPMPNQPMPPTMVTIASCMPAGFCVVGENPPD